jgi:hypothetical protein
MLRNRPIGARYNGLGLTANGIGTNMTISISGQAVSGPANCQQRSCVMSLTSNLAFPLAIQLLERTPALTLEKEYGPEIYQAAEKLLELVRQHNRSHESNLRPSLGERVMSDKEWELFFQLMDKIVNMEGTFTEKAAKVSAKAQKTESVGSLEEFVSWFEPEPESEQPDDQLKPEEDDAEESDPAYDDASDN